MGDRDTSIYIFCILTSNSADTTSVPNMPIFYVVSLLQNPAAHSGSKVHITTAMGKSQCVFALSVYLAAFFG